MHMAFHFIAAIITRYLIGTSPYTKYANAQGWLTFLVRNSIFYSYLLTLTKLEFLKLPDIKSKFSIKKPWILKWMTDMKLYPLQNMELHFAFQSNRGKLR